MLIVPELMPVIKSAIKKLKQSKVRATRNRKVRDGVKELVAKFRKKPTRESYSKITSVLDKAAKNNVLHKNKASRLKSRLSSLLTK